LLIKREKRREKEKGKREKRIEERCCLCILELTIYMVIPEVEV